MKYLSLFSGIGGFELGIEKCRDHRTFLQGTSATIILEDSTYIPSGSFGATCIGFSEIDQYAIKIYQQHFNHKNYGDIKTINAQSLPDFDLLVGGFPCQSFSIAGKRRGFNDTRGTLFFDIARILQSKRPKLLLLENVKGLLSHDGGRTFAVIIQTLTKLGYDLQWQVLNSKNHGVPQNRERVFIVGHLRGTRRPEVFPFGESYKKSDISTREESGFRVPPITTQGGRNLRGAFINELPQSQRVRGVDGLSSTLSANGGGMGAKTGLYMVDDPSRKKGLVDKNISPTLRSEAHGNLPSIVSDMKIRRLTPTECERLQGFPDGWTEGVSDAQRYKCLGNAVTVNVVQAIIERMFS